MWCGRHALSRAAAAEGATLIGACCMLQVATPSCVGPPRHSPARPSVYPACWWRLPQAAARCCRAAVLTHFPATQPAPAGPPARQVVVAEAAPTYQGQQMASELAAAGIHATLIPDSAIFAMMARVNKVGPWLVGASFVGAWGSRTGPGRAWQCSTRLTGRTRSQSGCRATREEGGVRGLHLGMAALFPALGWAQRVCQPRAAPLQPACPQQAAPCPAPPLSLLSLPGQAHSPPLLVPLGRSSPPRTRCWPTAR